MLALLVASVLSGPGDLRSAYQRADALPNLVRGKALNITLTPNWVGAGAMWYRAERGGGRADFVLVRIDGTKKPLFEPARLAEALAKLEGKVLDPEKWSITGVVVADDLASMHFSIEGNRYRVIFADYSVERAGRAAPPLEATRENEEGETHHEFPVPRVGAFVAQQGPRSNDSPDGKWTVGVEAGAVRVRPKQGGEWTTVSSTTGFTQARWSPDSKFLVGWKLDPGDRRQVHLLASSRRAETRGVLESRLYDQPGDKLDTYAPFVLDVEKKTEVKVDIEPIVGGGQPWSGPPGVDWRGSRFVLDYSSRGYQTYNVVQVELATGKATPLVKETYPTFFDSTSVMMRFIDQPNELVWRSERDGWGHLYLLNGDTGAVKGQITRGEWVVRSIEGLDSTNRTITFMANGREPGDPYHQYLYRVGLDGSDLKLLTPEKGTHRVTWSTDRSTFLDTYSQVDRPQVHEWRKADGTLISRLESADVTGMAEFKLKPVEPFVAKGRDGKTDIWGIVVRPSSFDRRKRYPVIENIYAGPHDSHVPKTYAALLRMHRLAELGFIVVQIDGMGTRNRGKAFHDVCWQNIADAGFPDRIAWMKALAAKDKSVDISRVGIYGTSAGGQNAAAALLFHGDFYKAGVASCGCHDNRIDKMWWNEQWMGYPVGPHYAKQSNIENADKLKGKLLLIVGELDRNVPPETTFRFADALQKSKKEFDFVVIPGADHTDGGDYGERKRRDFFVRWLLGKEPPSWNETP